MTITSGFSLGQSDLRQVSYLSGITIASLNMSIVPMNDPPGNTLSIKTLVETVLSSAATHLGVMSLSSQVRPSGDIAQYSSIDKVTTGAFIDRE